MSALPKRSIAVVAHAKDDLRVDEVDVRAPAPDEAVVRIAFGGVCGSDLHYWTHGAAGESILKAPMILGHEVVGTVVAAAADGRGPAVGMRVAVHPATENSYLGSAARYPHTEGAFTEYAVLPARMLRALPEHLELRDAALIEPASVAWHAVSRAGDLAGKRVLVVGSGPIGALIVAVAKRAGASEIVAVDMHDKPLEIAAAVGATSTIVATDAAAIDAVGADVVFESSGSYRGLGSAVRGAARGGRVVMVGLLPSGEQPALISLAITRELTLIGSFRFGDEIDEVIAALADGSLEVAPIVTHEFAASDAHEAFETAKDSSRSGKVLLRF